MPDRASIEIEINFPDWWWLPDEEPERWEKTRTDIDQAVRAALAQNGFLQEQYEVVFHVW